MKTLSIEKSDDYFQEFWDNVSKEFIKIETLQDYSGEDNGRSLQAWLDGDKPTSIRYMMEDRPDEWISMCQEKVTSGVTLKRFRIVEEPYSQYLDWELEHYKHINIPLCGEEIYLVTTSELAGLDTAYMDVMIFDRKRIVENQYSASGQMTQQTFYNEGDDIGKFLKIIPKLADKAKKVR